MDQAAALQTVRSFNRTVAERIGALTDSFLGRDRPMGESRTLWEIGPEGAEVRELRSRLGLDSGYATRVLQSLRRQGLVTVEHSPADGRVRQVRLTPSGLAERAELDRRADRVALSFVEPLNEAQRLKLLAAIADVERLLTASMVEIAVEDPGSAGARWCIGQYFEELNRRFDAGFDPTRGITAEPEELRPPAGELLLARLRGRPVGCGALKFHRRAPAELKRMWVAPEARGLGLGRRLLSVLESHAAGAGARTVHLETNRALKEAIQLYRSAGYREVAPFNDEPYADHWFEKRLTHRR
ncbi:MAG TPA: bifunctional helix-turn-helix transcriptional regulator/GNAT family N-acetyltransferase [Candidatus Dormibacteraeota bacterium]|nr:bifunctional helix-turn-helix transcriptional regulator/GNAT family N-acetyltransferase [Candidatus Dormibacteraeota bacterium]